MKPMIPKDKKEPHLLLLQAMEPVAFPVSSMNEAPGNRKKELLSMSPVIGCFIQGFK